MAEKVKKTKKINRRTFKEIYGYERDKETPDQTVKRLMTARLETFVKKAEAVATLGSSPYKPSQDQRIYAISIIEGACEDTINALRQSKSEADQIEVPG